MIFCGKNLEFKHKATLCLAVIGILLNCLVCANKEGTFPFIEFLPNGHVRVHATQIVLSFGIFVNMLMIALFRKF